MHNTTSRYSNKEGFPYSYAEFLTNIGNNHCEINVKSCFNDINAETITFAWVLFICQTWKDITSCCQPYFSDFIVPRCYNWLL